MPQHPGPPLPPLRGPLLESLEVRGRIRTLNTYLMSSPCLAWVGQSTASWDQVFEAPQIQITQNLWKVVAGPRSGGHHGQDQPAP